MSAVAELHAGELKRQPGFAVPPAIEAQVDQLITRYPVKRSASLMVLHAIQQEFGWISADAVEWAAAKLGLQPINVYELVTFYPMFHRSKVGRYHLRVCRTLSCALGGSGQLHEKLCAKLGLDPEGHGPQTTPDGRFTLEFVECLAGCGTAPVMMCNETFYEGVSEAKAAQIVEGCR